MESLELPCDLLWEGELTSLSPSHLSNASAEEILIFEDSFATDLIPDIDLLKPEPELQLKLSAEAFIELLELQSEYEAMQDDNLDESFSNQWLDQPINIPLDEYSTPMQETRIYPVKNENTAQLLNEFNTVLDSVELTHLTPPQTPPRTPPQVCFNALNKTEFVFPSQAAWPQFQIHQLELPQQQQLCQSPQIKQIINYPIASHSQCQQSIFEQAIQLVQAPIPHDIAVEMEAVDALVRSRAEDLVDATDDDSTSESGSLTSSSCFSPRSEISTATDDSDWTPKPVAQFSTKSSLNSSDSCGGSKRKPRLNRRSVEDRQYRKKEQNKNAANRYRLKKKAEIEIILDEERDLAKRNDQLQVQYNDVKREVKYLKALMRELYQAKGIL